MTTVPLDQLAGLPLRLLARECDPFVHDFVLDVARSAGVELTLGRPAGRTYDTLVELGNGPPAWAVLVGSVPEAPAGVRVLPLRPARQVPVVLVLKDAKTTACTEALVAA